MVSRKPKPQSYDARIFNIPQDETSTTMKDFSPLMCIDGNNWQQKHFSRGGATTSWKHSKNKVLHLLIQLATLRLIQFQFHLYCGCLQIFVQIFNTESPCASSKFVHNFAHTRFVAQTNFGHAFTHFWRTLTPFGGNTTHWIHFVKTGGTNTLCRPQNSL
jgi:hypothetical protein